TTILANACRATSAADSFSRWRGSAIRWRRRATRPRLRMRPEPVAAPTLNVVLVRPEIPQNTGSISRLTAAVRARLHLVGPLGFSLEDRYLKRAGLDYWPLVDLRTYEGWEQFCAINREPASSKFFSTHADKSYLDAHYARSDFLFFGSET